MINGNMLIGEVDDFNSTLIKNERGLSLQPNQAQNGLQPVMVNMNQFFTNDKDFNYKEEHIVRRLTPIKEIESAYRQAISGLITNVSASDRLKLVA